MVLCNKKILTKIVFPVCTTNTKVLSLSEKELLDTSLSLTPLLR